MQARERLDGILNEASRLARGGEFAAARRLIDLVAADPDRARLGPETAAGLPRRLHSAMLRLAKAEGDAASRVALQYTLVPPPGVLAGVARVTAEERRALAEAARKPVPRVIHQIWIGGAPPPATAAWAEHAAARGYGYRLWREADLRRMEVDADPAFAAMIERGDLPGAVDVARYHVLWREGGIYLDCDWYPARQDIGFDDALPMVGLTAPAESVPRQTGVGSLLLANSLIAAPPGHPALRRSLDNLAGAIAALPRAPAWWVTGPLLFTLACRAGPVTVADAAIVAGHLPDGTDEAEVRRFCASVAPDAPGLLLHWKSWGRVAA